MRNDIQLSGDQIEAEFESIGVSADIDGLTFTRETIDDFHAARNRWASAGAIDDLNDETESGYTALVIEGAQTAKGEPRKDVYIIDFGAVRVVAA